MPALERPVTALPLTLAMPTPPPPDNALGAPFCAGRCGDERRYAEALQQCAAMLRRFTVAKLQRMAPGMLGDAEDVVQECLLALHLKSHTYDAAQPFEPWLYAVAHYKLIDLLPDKQRRPIELVKLEGRSVVEAAASTGLSVSAVKVGIHRGLKALAKRLAAEDTSP